QIGCGAIDGFYGQVVQLVYILRATVHLDGVFKLSHLCRAGGENQILVADGGDDIRCGKAVCLHGSGIGINGNEPLLAPVGERSGRTLNRRQLRAYEVVSEVEKLLFAEGFAGKAKLKHWNGGSGINNDERRSRARRQEAQERLRNSCGLRERSLN